ncbi:hypothetical protein GXM_00619 [Nostoc sphaeroides CCNUC1]|uniref:Uncharacterized protein n=1 Tax=Nostoc sphaeroides CCNUC1 TaxID=2653204 RepID=A0A5P8VSG9_9NOSO|nr:hypothetical protein GXM_00619 [Nostoc sphaeroides CCNUC1]
MAIALDYRLFSLSLKGFINYRPSNLGIVQLKKATVEAIWGDRIDTGCGLLKIT